MINVMYCMSCTVCHMLYVMYVQTYMSCMPGMYVVRYVRNPAVLYV